MKVCVKDEQSDLLIDKNSVIAIISFLVKALQIQADEVGIHLVSKEKMCALHEKYFADASPTDCMAFPIEKMPGYHILGDVFVCPAVAINFANSNEIDVYEEVSRYLVHGLLHLIGYEDDIDKREEMFRVQENLLQCALNKDQLVHA